MAKSDPSLTSVAVLQLWNPGTARMIWSFLQFTPPSYTSITCSRVVISCIFTNQKPLTSAFFKPRDPVLNGQGHQLAFVSEFCTDVAHVPEVDNVVADTLSRQHDDESDDGVGGKPTIVHAVAHLLFNVIVDELAVVQPQTPGVGQQNSLVLQHLQIPGCTRKVWCDMSQSRILVPLGWRKRVFNKVQDLSHPSGQATLAILARGYIWDGLRRDILCWARSCQVCARNKVSRHTCQLVQSILVQASRFEHVHVDMVGPFLREQGMKYILTMIDRTTRWLEAAAISDATANTILQAFHRGWISRFGIPRIVTSDLGAQFTSKAWTDSLTRLGVSVATTMSYHLQSKGLVERFHRSLKNALLCAVTGTKSWTRSLPWVLLGLRNAPRSEMATSAAEVLYRMALRVPGLCFWQEVVPEASEVRQLQLARSNVERYLPPQLNAKKFKQPPFIPKSLEDCTHVFPCEDSLAKPPLAPRYTGPYQVVEKSWGEQHLHHQDRRQAQSGSFGKGQDGHPGIVTQGRDVAATGLLGSWATCKASTLTINKEGRCERDFGTDSR